MSPLKRLGAIAIAVVIAFSVGQTLLAAEASAAPPCADLLLVFARGSGQTVAADHEPTSESSTFFGEIRKHTPPGLDIAEYRLGDPGYRGNSYPAQDWSTFGNIIRFNAHYDDSVDVGAREMRLLLSDRALQCPLEEWIIGGYSQGGQVVSRALGELSSDVRSRVGFAATFGDPTLDAYGGFPCRRAWYSRGNVKCFQHGILGPRLPYIPNDLRGRFGAWCDWLDPVCAMGDFFWVHSDYPDAAIPQAALEALSTVRPQHGWHLENLQIGSGTAGVDLMVVFDTTGSMGGAIEQAKQAALQLADLVQGRPNGRIGLVQFRDAGDSPEVELVSALTSSGSQFASGLDTLYASGGGDTPEAQLAGILAALNGAGWRHGATKLLTVITDAPGKDPDPITGSTRADVTQRANEIDPVGIFGVDICGCGASEWMQPLADGTGGKVIAGSEGVVTAMEEVVDEASARPVVQIQDTTYAEPGQPVTFSADGSYDPDSEIEKYLWDLNGDGSFEAETVAPEIIHTYEFPVTTTVAVLAKADDGGTGAATTNLIVRSGWREELSPSEPRDAALRETRPGTVEVSWQPPSTGPLPTGYGVYASNGILAAFGNGEARTVTIDELPLGSTQLFTIRAVASGLLGAPVSTPAITLSGVAARPIAADNPGKSPSKLRRAVAARVLAKRIRVHNRSLEIPLLCPKGSTSTCQVALRIGVGKPPVTYRRRTGIRPGKVKKVILVLPAAVARRTSPIELQLAFVTRTSAGSTRSVAHVRVDGNGSRSG